MSSDPPETPELATNEEWRGIMVRARKDKKLTQKELGGRVGTSQNIVSLIESGEVATSQFVLPICRVLGIPPPMFFSDDEQKTWSQLGHILRGKSMKKFRRAMDLVAALVEEDEDDADEVMPSRKPAGRDGASRPASRK